MSMKKWLQTRQVWRLITASLLLFSLALLLPTAAMAQDGEGGGEEEEKVETKIATVDDDKLQTEAPTLEGEKKGTDVIRGENFAKQRKFESLKKLDGQIQKIKKLISITPEDHPDRPEFLFNLADVVHICLLGRHDGSKMVQHLNPLLDACP